MSAPTAAHSALDLAALRAEFPALRRTHGGRAVAYFEQELTPAVAREDSDPMAEWLEYGRFLASLAALDPKPFVVAGGQFWTAHTRSTAFELGADHVEHDPRALVAELHIRVPPPG